MPARAHSRMKMGYTRPEGGHPGRLNCSATSLIYRLTRMLFGTLDCGTRRAPGSTHMSFLQLTSILLALTFGTMTVDLLALAAWLLSLEVTHVAMESTGEYWKPVYNLLEGSFTLLVVNAQHIKNVPGRKTDVKDAEWIADLLCHGLVRGSFIPPQAQRDLRDLTERRTNLVRDRATVVNRLQKVLEWANIKLAAVVSDVVGVSA